MNNKINVSQFIYDHLSNTIKAEDVEYMEVSGDKYFLSEGMIDLENKEIAGKDIKIFLQNESFGNNKNNPRLLGKTINNTSNFTIIKKGIFTTCKKNNDKCPPWQITSKKIVHNKKKREIHYKNAWLKLYDFPIMYFPKFFHPDPSVDRKSGFLIPSFSNSKNLGLSVKIPYFYAISDSADLTFSPRIFSNEEFLIQTEARKELKNSSHIVDFSINKKNDDGKLGRKTHFFSNSEIDLYSNYFDETVLDLKIEKVSNDNYIKQYSLRVFESNNKRYKCARISN